MSFAVAAVIGSCNLHNPGVTPPAAALSYPTALALSREEKPRFLYIANSNFDLRYNAGTVHSYDLDALDAVLAQGCLAYGELRLPDGGLRSFGTGTRSFEDNTVYAASGLDGGTPASDAGADDAGAVADSGLIGTSLDGGAIVLPADYGLTADYGNARGFLCDGRDPSGPAEDPGRYQKCCFDSQEKLDVIRKSSFEIDSFAAGIAVAPDNRRIYVPVASRNTLVYLDSNDGALSCGESDNRCRRGPRRGVDTDDPDHDFPGQLSTVTSGLLGELIPSGQELNLDRNATYVATTHELGSFSLFVEQAGKPVLESVLSELGRRPRSLTVDPRKNIFYVTSASEPFISRIGLRVSPTGVPGEEGARELLYESSRVYLAGVSQPDDLRDVAVDPTNPDRIYALVRGSQESVAFLDLDSTLLNTKARLIDAVRIGAGPSKLILIQQDGKTFLVVSNYDEKSVHIIDAETHRLVALVRSFSGPFSMAYDGARKLLHVADFRASILRVVDLKGLTQKDQLPPRIVATIGSPQFEGGIQ